jgi:hypothetical protein
MSSQGTIASMKTKAPTSGITVWDRVLRFEKDPSPTAARELLRLQFSEDDHERMHQLSAKARAGTLSSKEEAEIDTFERLGCVLDILHAAARRTLKRRKSAS